MELEVAVGGLFELALEVAVGRLVDLVVVAVPVQLVVAVLVAFVAAEGLTVPQREMKTFFSGRLANLEGEKDDFLDVMEREYGKIPCVSSLLFFVPPAPLHFFYEFRRCDVEASRSKSK